MTGLGRLYRGCARSRDYYSRRHSTQVARRLQLHPDTTVSSKLFR